MEERGGEREGERESKIKSGREGKREGGREDGWEERERKRVRGTDCRPAVGLKDPLQTVGGGGPVAGLCLLSTALGSDICVVVFLG